MISQNVQMIQVICFCYELHYTSTKCKLVANIKCTGIAYTRMLPWHVHIIIHVCIHTDLTCTILALWLVLVLVLVLDVAVADPVSIMFGLEELD